MGYKIKMGKRILTCENCSEEAFAEGDCPNELIQSSGYIHSDKDDNIWFCSKKCEKEYDNK